MAFKIPFSIAAAILFAIAISLAVLPVIGIILTAPIAIILLLVGIRLGFIQKPTFKDFFLLPLMAIILTIAMAIITANQFANIPLLQIIIVGILVDIVLFFLGFLEVLPIMGQFINSTIAFIIVSFALGGIPGLILGTLASFIALIPGHIPGIVTIIFIIIKLIVG